MGRRGRPPKYLDEEILLGRILGLWREKGDVLTFSEIHREFVRMGLVSSIKYRANSNKGICKKFGYISLF